MRALVLSDIHANIDALHAIDAWRANQPSFDAIWLLGDLVDYGGAPDEVIDWARTHATLVVRGNHDHAMATGAGCGSSAIFLGLSVATREYFRSRLPQADLHYLSSLPVEMSVETPGCGRTVIVHATPQDPLFGFVPASANEEIWRAAIAPANEPRFLFAGHTHDQFVRSVGRTTIVNPGSAGLPTDGDPRAAFAVFDEGVVRLHRVPYDVGRAAARVCGLPIAVDYRRRLDVLIRHARLLEPREPAESSDVT